MPLLGLFAALTLLVQDPPPRFVAGQPAPELDACRWLSGVRDEAKGADGESGDVLASGNMTQPPARPSIDRLAGWVVLVLRLDGSNPATLASELSLLREICEANEDRTLWSIGLTAGPESEELGKEWTRAAIRGACGVVEGERCYADPTHPKLSIIGRSGELVWVGDPVASQKEFQSMVLVALNRRAAPRIPAQLEPALDASLADYFAGRFEKARSAAKKHASAKPKTDAQKALASDAGLLLETIERHEAALVKRVHDAKVKQSVAELVLLDEILQAGFKGEVAELAEEELKQLNAGMTGWTSSDYVDWLKVEKQRPLFFPLRKDAEGKKYAKELERFTKTTWGFTAPVKRAEELIARFERGAR